MTYPSAWPPGAGGSHTGGSYSGGPSYPGGPPYSGGPSYPGGPQNAPGGAYPPNMPQPVAAPLPPRDAYQRPGRVEAIPGTRFGVVHLEVPPATSGLAIGALVAGIASILVSLAVVCFGLVGAQGGWGAWAAGAFTLLGLVAAVGGVALGWLARRQIGRVGPAAAMRFTGRGLALAGLICGFVGFGITVIGFFAALALQLGA